MFVFGDIPFLAFPHGNWVDSRLMLPFQHASAHDNANRLDTGTADEWLLLWLSEREVLGSPSGWLF
jgi:hypothetical protein